MRRVIVALLVSLCIASCATLGGRSGKKAKAGNLDIYFLDMSGGASTLIVTPSGESVLIDTGSLEPKDRDAGRIYRATQAAGLKQIDHLVTTHFHSDHFGGLLALSKMIPIKAFYDKGALAPAEDKDQTERLYPLYREATRGRVAEIKPGDDMPLRSDPAGRIPFVRLHCVAAEKKVEGFDGDVDGRIAGFDIRQPDSGDNARSIALVLTYGKFRCFMGGDITWNMEHHLAQPKNIIGKVDLYQVTHHGMDLSNNPLLMRALSPTVCVAMNGPRKGIQPATFRTLQELPGMQAIYQIHYNKQYGDRGNAPPEFIANMNDPSKGEFIKVAVNAREGCFTVSIGANGFKKTYRIQEKE